MALALSVPYLGYRDAIIAMTYAVVIFSIIVQGLTIRSVILRTIPSIPLAEEPRQRRLEQQLVALADGKPLSLNGGRHENTHRADGQCGTATHAARNDTTRFSGFVRRMAANFFGNLGDVPAGRGGRGRGRSGSEERRRSHLGHGRGGARHDGHGRHLLHGHGKRGTSQSRRHFRLRLTTEFSLAVACPATSSGRLRAASQPRSSCALCSGRLANSAPPSRARA